MGICFGVKVSGGAGFLVLGLCWPPAALGNATDAEATDKPSYVVEETLVSGKRDPKAPAIATKLPLALQSTPVSVGVVGHGTTELQAGTILGDALKNVSGVNVQSGFGVFDFFLIRGFDSLDNGLVLTDGAAEPEVTFYNLYNVEQVEVLKGPGAFLYGANPLSGTVNIVRKRPTFENFARASASVGRFSTYRTAVDLGRGDDDGALAYRLNAQLQGSDNYRDTKDNHSFGINPTLVWRRGDRTLDLNAEYSISEYKTDAGLPILGGQLVDVPRTRSYQSPFDISDQTVYRLRADFNAPISEGVSLRDKVYFTDLDWASTGTLFTGPAFDQQGQLMPGLAGRTLTVLENRQRLTGNQLEIVIKKSTGMVNHLLLAGVEVSRLVDEYTLDVALLPGIGIDDPVETASKPFVLLPSQRRSGTARTHSLAPYAVDRLALTDKFQLFASGRLDVIDYEDEDNGLAQDYARFSPMVGLVYEPSQQLSFYASGGRAFAPPSSLGRGERQIEESRQLEIGTRKQLSRRVDGALAVYRLEKDVARDDGVTRHSGKQRSQGIELDLTARPAKGWEWVLSYAFTRGELRNFDELFRRPNPDGTVAEINVDLSGNRPAFVPEHLLNLWATKQFSRTVWLGAGMRYTGGQFTSTDNAFKIDPTLTFDAALSYIRGPGRLQLNLKNLTNREYETRGFGSASVIPANPVSLRATVDWEW